MTVKIKDDGGPAFPRGPIGEECHRPYGHQHGMSLRDYFAGQALANPAICKHDDDWPQKTAYAFADAMIAERDK